jgi:hypothetical protein
LRGYTIDFRESRVDGGLAFSNPGVVQACCGSGAGKPAAKATVSFMPRPPAVAAAPAAE